MSYVHCASENNSWQRRGVPSSADPYPETSLSDVEADRQRQTSISQSKEPTR